MKSTQVVIDFPSTFELNEFLAHTAKFPVWVSVRIPYEGKFATFPDECIFPHRELYCLKEHCEDHD